MEIQRDWEWGGKKEKKKGREVKTGVAGKREMRCVGGCQILAD